MQWLRLYHDARHDPKWRALAIETGHPEATILGVWAYMLMHAGDSEERGVLTDWDDRIHGAACGLTATQMKVIREAMQGVVLDGLRIRAWDKRQRASDDAAERQRKTRARRQEPDTPGGGGQRTGADDSQGNADVPLRNGHVAGHVGTVTEHNVTVTLQTDDVTRHSAHVTRQSHDVAEQSLRAQTTDTEIESKKEPPLSPPLGGMVDGFPSGNLSVLPTLASRAWGTSAPPMPAAAPGATTGQADLLAPFDAPTVRAPTPAASGRHRGRRRNGPRKPEEIAPEILAKWEEFRDAYPRRGAVNPVAEGREVFVRCVESGCDPDLMIGAARAYGRIERDAVGTRGIAHYTTFLNRGEEHWRQCIDDAANPAAGSNNVHPLRPGQPGRGNGPHDPQPFRPRHAGIQV